MTIEELEKKLTELEDLHAELKTQIAELKERGEEKPKPQHPRWTPKENEIYYTIMLSSGNIDILNWSNTYALHKDRFRLGNVYKTKAEAEFAAERMIVLAEMREWAGEWRNVYALAWDNIHHRIITRASLVYQGELCFATKEDAENCIKAVGEDRIKKYYFMIPEEETKNG